jgi:hypothetical protein
MAQSDLLGTTGWLSGCWEGVRGNRVTLEMWMPPGGNVMLGGSRTMVGSEVRELEQLRLSEEGGHLVYRALVGDQPVTPFTSVAVTDSSFTVENLAHDFPQRIIYRRRGADSLLARIEGPGPQGTRGVDYPMKRVSCTVP